MRFQTKLLATYSLLVFLLILLLGIVFYRYSSNLFERNASSTYGLLSSKLSRQLDDTIRPMDFISVNLLSGEQFKSSLATLARIDRKDPGNADFLNDAIRLIRSDLLSYSIYKYFYSVIVLTPEGDFFSSNFTYHSSITHIEKPLSYLPWIAKAVRADGRAVIIPPYVDPWNTAVPQNVFSLVRLVPGQNGDIGYIEVQNPYGKLETLFTLPDSEFVKILAFLPGGELLYSSGNIPADLVEFYRKRSGTSQVETRFRTNGLTGEKELVVSDVSGYTGITVVLVLNRSVLLKPLMFTEIMILIIGLLLFLLSAAYNYGSSRLLSKPLRMIRDRMEETELGNLPDSNPLDHPDDEIVAVDRAFQRLKERLDDAIRKEFISHTAWMQARFDSLQAQINPHFLYNILTVIASRGLELGDEEIGKICDGIASMLRYSTSTAERSALLSQELEHVRTYLFLMKTRFENRFEFEFRIDPAILAVRIPKMVLQQIVENSINHGYRSVHKPMHITIDGRLEDSRWILELCDNGQGFDPGKLEELERQTAGIAESLRTDAGNDGFGIGGLGLLNTFSRLFLFYGGNFTWKLENLASGGAKVTIGGMHSAEER